MNLDFLTDAFVTYSSEGIGKAIADVIRALYHVLFPANADVPHTLPPIE
ncbi:hypothetical protein I6I68_00670 [Corynebacterium glucuronolyticum]|nr:hypothetical protein [Corynebacterium glucuronolyticum]QQU88553.1 hypothetical protein I6I68_00670 [Corynebacterium glucuronolyticum]